MLNSAAGQDDIIQIVPLIYKDLLINNKNDSFLSNYEKLLDYNVDDVCHMILTDNSILCFDVADSPTVDDFLAFSPAQRLVFVKDRLILLINKTKHLPDEECTLLPIDHFHESYYLQLLIDVVNCLILKNVSPSLVVESVCLAACFVEIGPVLVNSIILNNPGREFDVVRGILRRFDSKDLSYGFRSHLGSVVSHLCNHSPPLVTAILDLIISLRRFPELFFSLMPPADMVTWACRIFCQGRSDWVVADEYVASQVESFYVRLVDHPDLFGRELHVRLVGVLCPPLCGGVELMERTLLGVLEPLRDSHDIVVSIISLINSVSGMVAQHERLMLLVGEWFRFHVNPFPQNMSSCLMVTSLLVTSPNSALFEKTISGIIGNVTFQGTLRSMRSVVRGIVVPNLADVVFQVVGLAAETANSSHLVTLLQFVVRWCHDNSLDSSQSSIVERALVLLVLAAREGDGDHTVDILEFFLQSPLRKVGGLPRHDLWDIFTRISRDFSLHRQMLFLFYVLLLYCHDPCEDLFYNLLSYLPVRLLVWEAASRQVGNLYPSLLRLVVAYLPFFSCVDDWLRGQSSVIGRPHAAVVVSNMRSNFGGSPLFDDNRILRFVRDMTDDTSLWWDLNLVYPRLVTLTLTAWIGQSFEHIPCDPLILFRCNPTVFQRLPLLEIFLYILQLTISYSSLHFIRQLQSSDSKNAHLRSLTDTFLFSKDCAAYIRLLTLSQTPIQESVRLEALTVSERRCELIGAFLHRVFIKNREILQMIHFQTYPHELIPMICRHIPSMHVCFDFLSNLINHSEIERHVFGVRLLAGLADKYNIGAAFKVGRVALDIITLNYDNLPPVERPLYVLCLLDSLVGVCLARKDLRTAYVDFIVRVARECHLVVSLSAPLFVDFNLRRSSMTYERTCRLLYSRLISTIGQIMDKCDISALSTGFI